MDETNANGLRGKKERKCYVEWSIYEGKRVVKGCKWNVTRNLTGLWWLGATNSATEEKTSNHLNVITGNFTQAPKFVTKLKLFRTDNKNQSSNSYTRNRYY